MNTQDKFIAQIARMKTEEEFEEGEVPPSEDWICTLNELIVAARRLKPRRRNPLIAAAPDLLKQLKSAAESLHYLTSEQFDDDHEANWDRTLEDIEKAIAKAERKKS